MPTTTTTKATTARKIATQRKQGDAAIRAIVTQGTLSPKTTARKPATKSTAKPAAKTTKSTTPVPAPAAKVERLAEELRAVEASITEHGLDNERQHGSDPLYVKRNKAILALVDAGAGFSFIAATRGKPASTNRGLIRVLQGGKRL